MYLLVSHSDGLGDAPYFHSDGVASLNWPMTVSALPSPAIDAQNVNAPAANLLEGFGQGLGGKGVAGGGYYK